MFNEHNNETYSNDTFVAGNYGILTSPRLEWKLAAGEWTPDNRSWRLTPGLEVCGAHWRKVGMKDASFSSSGSQVSDEALAAAIRDKLGAQNAGEGKDSVQVEFTAEELATIAVRELQYTSCVLVDGRLWRPAGGETKNIEPGLRRKVMCLEEFMRPPADAAEEERWRHQRAEKGAAWLEGLSQLEQARRCVVVAKLIPEEVLALRLWSGPMYAEYNSVLRRGVRGKFTTTLHALDSAIIKLARIGTPEIVYRGISGRAFQAHDFKAGVFVETGAQSFTRSREVALEYASHSAGGASYLVRVLEGEADKGADISPFSYYFHEKEKLYGALVMMQVTSSISLSPGDEGNVCGLPCCDDVV